MKEIPGKIIFKAIVGSQSYGTATPESDIDIKGVYIQNVEDLVGFGYQEQINVNKDECYYEIRRFLQLAQTGNPTVLELLFTPEDCILESSPEFDLVKAEAEKFLTQKCYNSFAGYAHMQIEKATGLNKKMNYEKEKITRKGPLDFCYVTLFGKTYTVTEYLKTTGMKQEKVGLTRLDHFRDTYAFYYDPTGLEKFKGIVGEDSNQLRLSAIPKGMIPHTVLYFNEPEYSKHCKEYKEYQEWLEKRNVARYVDVESHGQKIDGKNLLHCRRLIDVAKEIPVLKTIRVRRPNADYLLEIRKGKHSLLEILAEAKKDLEGLKELYQNSDLPVEMNQNFVNDLLLRVRKLNNPNL